ncbi:MAG: RNA polymerase sigma factor [Anaerolineae bacterium]|nr:RNA polymerase sigma factor [Anaerolineae bacterium]
MAEDEIIARAIGGDEVAQQALYEAYYASAFRLAYLLLSNADDAEEAVQDAFVYLFRNLRHYSPQRGPLWAWLRVILVSRCRNRRRARQWHLLALSALDHGALDEDTTDDPAHMLEQLGTRRAVWEALQQVSPAAREALILRYYEGLSYAEIAALSGCQEEAARARVSHGKVQLRRLLEEQAEAENRIAEGKVAEGNALG